MCVHLTFGPPCRLCNAVVSDSTKKCNNRKVKVSYNKLKKLIQAIAAQKEFFANEKKRANFGKTKT